MDDDKNGEDDDGSIVRRVEALFLDLLLLLLVRGCVLGAPVATAYTDRKTVDEDAVSDTTDADDVDDA